MGKSVDVLVEPGEPAAQVHPDHQHETSTSGSALHPPHPLVRACDTLVDAVVVAFATWTVVYHVCLLFRLGVAWAVPMEIAALALCAIALVRRRRHESGQLHLSDSAWPADTATSPSRAARRLPARMSTAGPVVTVCFAGLAAISAAADAPWALVTIGWIGAAATGSAWAAVSVAPRLATVRTPPWEAVLALVLAVAMAVLSLAILRSNADDVYYVNLSQFVAANGTFPLRDSIFGNLEYPMSSWPPMASYDGLAGTVAHLAGIRAAPVVYIVAPPITSFLSVLCLWRLLRAWRVKAVSVALTSGLVFLLLDGIAQHSPGNLFVTRIYQAKIVFLCVMVPVLLVYALAYIERPTRSRLLRLFIGGVAAVGVTTSAIFLTPVIALAASAPLLRRSPRKAGLAFAAMAAYPLAAGVVTKAVGGRSADSFNAILRFEPAVFGRQIFDHGVIALIAIAAILLGTLLVPHQPARITTGLLALAVGITYLPGFTQLSFDVIGLGPTLWRMSWLLTIAALVGVAVSRVTQLLPRRWLGVAGPAALAVLLLLVSDPIWAGSTTARWSAPFHLQRNPDTVAMANRVIARSSPGDLVLAPEELAVTISVLTTRIHSVVPRAYFTVYLKDNPAFHYDARRALASFVGTGDWQRDEVLRALRVVGVDLVCLKSRQEGRVHLLEKVGYRTAYLLAGYRCLRPT